jgi:UDP-2,3-diacylglucosamine pyrophosphatase LpxH
MSLHDAVLSALGSVADVRLVASLRDPRLGFNSTTDLHVFIPDLHLVSNEVRPRYKYGTNEIGMLTAALAALGELRSVERAGARRIGIFQMGDFLDIWREAPFLTPGFDAAARITDSHPALMAEFGSGRLGARFLLGNHDFELYRHERFSRMSKRRFFLAPAGASAAGLALHGDIFDWQEQFPDAFQSLVVFYISPLREPEERHLEEMLALVHTENRELNLTEGIAGTARLGAVAALQPHQVNVPERFNLTGHKFLGPAKDLCQRLNRDLQFNMHYAVIGHTHHARIAVDESSNGFFALIDTGAWIESCELPDGSRLPNAQLTAISDNEVRIYQLIRRTV